MAIIYGERGKKKKRKCTSSLLQEITSESDDSWLPHVVNRLILAAIDRTDRERELAAQLMAFMEGSLLNQMHILNGYRYILSIISDIVLDVPMALEHVSKFLARSVVDDLILPVFLEELREEFNGKAGGEVVSHARLFLRARHSAERVLSFWGGAYSGSLQHAKTEYVKMLKVGERHYSLIVFFFVFFLF